MKKQNGCYALCKSKTQIKLRKDRTKTLFPIALYPIQKGQALAGTPIANIQTGDLCDEKDIHSFLEYLSEKGIDIGSRINRQLQI